MSKLVLQADNAVNGSTTSRLIVTAPPKAGSLGIDLAVLSQVADVAYLLKVLGFAGLAGAAIGPSVIQLSRQLGKKRILRTETRDDGVTTVTYQDDAQEKQIECNNAVATLVADPEVRKALIETIQKPLDGLENQTFRVETADGEVILELEQNDIEEIQPLPSRTMETIVERRQRMEIYFVRLNFDSASAGWRARHMNDEFTVKIEDAVFFNTVRENQTSFSKDTLYVVNMDIRTVHNARGSKTTYKVIEILRQRN
jgi:hypothetical protein